MIKDEALIDDALIAAIDLLRSEFKQCIIKQNKTEIAEIEMKRFYDAKFEMVDLAFGRLLDRIIKLEGGLDGSHNGI